jgi:ankyrin repeat protein
MAVNLLINAGIDVNVEDAVTGRTALRLAAHGGHVEVVRLLLNAGADVKTALYLADHRGHTGVINLLMNAGAKNSMTLHEAATGGYAEVVKWWVNAVSDVDVLDHESDMTALHLATRNGHTKVVEVLIDAKANVNSISRSGKTALYMAAEGGHTEMVKILMHAGGIVSMESSRDAMNSPHGSTASGASSFTKSSDSSVLTGTTALHLAAKGGRVELVEFLVNAVTDVDVLDSAGMTALHLAARGGHTKVVETLIDAGADRSGVTALHLAAEGGHTEVVRVLVHAGGNVNKKSHRGDAMNSLCGSIASWATVSFLESSDFSLLSNSSTGTTALHLAAKGGHFDLIEFLVKTVTDVDVLDSAGMTALHLAAHGGHTKVVEVLLGAGARVNMQDKTGMTALHLAAHAKNPYLADMLRKANIDNEEMMYATRHVDKYGLDLDNDMLVYILNKADIIDRKTLSVLYSTRPDIAMLLLRHGANVDLQSAKWESALSLALYDSRMFTIIHKAVSEFDVWK